MYAIMYYYKCIIEWIINYLEPDSFKSKLFKQKKKIIESNGTSKVLLMNEDVTI